MDKKKPKADDKEYFNSKDLIRHNTYFSSASSGLNVSLF
jgi:hypothetical protein